MINLRYHIVSLTAVFLAIGIGLTLGSTFLDRATVDNLQGQLENLETRLQERDERIGELEGRLDEQAAVQTALDEQGAALLAGWLEEVPVAVVAARGVDEADVQGALTALQAAGADSHGIFWLTSRFGLDEAAEVDDLAGVLGESSDDPSRLRRMAIDLLGGELRDQQIGTPVGDEIDPGDDPPSTGTTGTTDGTDDETGTGDETGTDDETATADTTVDAPAGPAPADLDLLELLVESGFVEFEPVPGGPEEPAFPEGTRLLLVGGSTEVPDDLVIEPLVARMARGASTPLLAVAGSARAEDGQVSDLVAVIREDEELREVISTVDDLEHFESWAATVLALATPDVVGHYGVAEGASSVLPPLPSP